MLLVLVSALSAGAADMPKNALHYESFAAARVNPLGLQETFALGLRKRLSDSDSVLFKGTYLDIGGTSIVTPAYARIGPRIQLFPIALLRLTAMWETGGYFGTFNQLQSYDDTDIDYSDAALDADDDYAARGSMGTLEGRLQAKAWRIAIRNTFTAHRFDVAAPVGDDAFYEQYNDVLAPTHGWVYRDDADLLYVSEGKLVAGARYTWTRAFHDDGSDADTPTQRVGPLIAYTFHDEPGRAFNQPTILVVANWWMKHPYRTGQEVSVGVPYLVLGFAFNGDLTGS